MISIMKLLDQLFFCLWYFVSRQHTITELGKEKFYLAVSKSFSRIDPFTISRFGASWIWEISDWLNSASNFPVSSSFSGLMGNFPAGPMSIAVPKPDAIPRPFTWIVCWIFYQFETSIFIKIEKYIHNLSALTSSPDFFPIAGNSSGRPLATARTPAMEATRGNQANIAFIFLNKIIFTLFLISSWFCR